MEGCSTAEVHHRDREPWGGPLGLLQLAAEAPPVRLGEPCSSPPAAA
jgi:hypothetical protein